MSRTAPSRTAFSPAVQWLALLVGSLVIGACSLSDPAVRADNASTPTTTTSVAIDGNLLTPSTEPVVTTAPPAPDAASEAPADDLADIAGQIVRRTQAGALVVSNPDGSNEVELASSSASQHSQPTWAHSGDRLAWSTVDATGSRLTIATLTDGTASTIETLAPSPAFYLSWSAGDTWLAGLRNGAAGIELFITESTTADTRLVGPGQPFFTDWVDDDRLIAAIGATVLADIPADGSEPTQRTLADPLGAFQAPLVLPAERVVVALDDAGNNSNELVMLDRERITTLATAAGPVLMSANAQGSKLAIFVAGGSVQSEVISYQVNPPQDLPVGQVSILDLETGELTTRPETRLAAINWSPDGQMLGMLQVGDDDATWLFVRGEDVIDGTPFVPSAELAAAYLPFSDQYERSSTWWSPDSAAIVFAGTVDGEPGIWVDRVDDDRTATRIGSGDIAFWSPQ